MPHKVNPSDSAPSSRGSSGERITVSDAPDSNPVTRSTSGTKVVVHNGGGPSYDERRPAGWDKTKWK